VVSRPGALVTGGGTGIGLASAIALARQGCDIVIAGRRKQVLDDAVATIRVAAPAASVQQICCDLAGPDAPEALVQQAVQVLGQVDVLVNAAATCVPSDTLSLTSQTWDATVNVALRGAALCSIAAARNMVERGGGRIIMITSVDAAQSEPNVAHYCAAKAGLAAFARSLAVDLGDRGVIVNNVAPGWVMTPTAEQRLRQATAGSIARLNPLARPAEPDEIANVVAYLAIQAPSYLTGATITVDGGQTVKAAMP
jgi:NAD(P)-dependent dehydrogenase (short-subunit alcohol dehydrogenase family)